MKVLAKRGRGCCSDALAEMGKRCIFEVRSELCRKAAKMIKCIYYLKLPDNLRQCIHYFSGSVAAPEVMVDTERSRDHVGRMLNKLVDQVLIEFFFTFAVVFDLAERHLAMRPPA